MNEIITTYEPDNSLKKGYLFIFKEIFNEFKNNRWLMYQLFKRDFCALYKQTLIGIFWTFIIPLISIGTFVIFNYAGIFTISDIPFPYAIYALLGMAFWQIFSIGLMAGSNSLVKAGSMLVKINFSKKSLVIASCLQSITSFIIQFILVIILLFWYKITPSIAILFVPIFIIPIILLTIGFSLILSLLNGIMRDIGNSLSSIITFLMFLTPIFYKKPTTGILSTITKYNPLYYLISTSREIILTGTTTEWIGFLFSIIISIIIFTLCLIIFHLTETRVTERI
ncbi:MAG: ABC transporter permease [bacterium]